MTTAGRAAVMTERERKIEAIAKAAVTWVYDKNCANALMDLEDAVVALIGIPIEDADRAPTFPEKDQTS